MPEQQPTFEQVLSVLVEISDAIDDLTVPASVSDTLRVKLAQAGDLLGQLAAEQRHLQLQAHFDQSARCSLEEELRQRRWHARNCPVALPARPARPSHT